MTREIRPIAASMLIMLLIAEGHEVGLAAAALASFAAGQLGYRWIRG